MRHTPYNPRVWYQNRPRRQFRTKASAAEISDFARLARELVQATPEWQRPPEENAGKSQPDLPQRGPSSANAGNG